MKNWLRKWFAGEQQQPQAGAGADERSDAQAVLQRLEWTVLRRLDGLLQGHHRTLMRGQGLDLADLREYQAQDDVRHIDWNLTARLDQPHVRIYTEDREMTAWFLLDLSGSVDFGSGTRRKNHLSRDFVAAVARLLTREGNRVGALLYGSAVETVLPPRGGRLQVLQLLHRLQNRPQPVPTAQATQLQHLLQAATHHIKRRSTVFVVSDFISEPGWQASLGLLARRHDVVAVRLFDPLEMELPDLGMVPLRDAETGETLMVDTHDRRFRQRFAELASQREQALRQALSASGVDALELRTDDDLLDALVRFCQLRQRRVRAALPAAA
jgi:uncharacterized protein (DUF58 family)